MGKIDSFFYRVFNNPAIVYIISRYGTYIVQFINSLFIAVYLGPYYLGIWGFIHLVTGYAGQLNFGISHSVNVIISVNKQKDEYVRKIIGNGFTMIICLSVLICLFFVLNKIGMIEIGTKYNFETYILPVALIAVFTHINGLLSNIFRVFGKIYAIAINQTLNPILILILLPFFRESSLLWAMLMANVIAFILSFILFMFQLPVKFNLIFNWDIVKFIQIKGWYLFIYNASFYLIILTTNTFISSNYEVKEFGYYTFSYSLANVVLLLLNSISFLIFPKLLNRFATLSNAKIIEVLSNVRAAYISLAHLLIHFVIMVFPIFLLIFPEYNNSATAFNITALSIVIYTNSFGYQGVLMAKGKEKLIAIIALCALLINIVFGSVLVYLFDVPFSFVILATLITYFLYVLVMGLFGRRTLGLSIDLYSTISDVYPWRMMLAFFLSLFFSILNVSECFFTLPFILYLYLNKTEILNLKSFIQKIIHNPNFLNI